MSPQREAVVSFSMRLAKAYPGATVAEAMALLLSARRLRGVPSELADGTAPLSQAGGSFTWIACEGLLLVNLSPGSDTPAWEAVP